MSATQTFRDQHRPLQELARELTLLRAWNKSFKPGQSQEKLLVFAEAGVLFMALEHFLRIVVGNCLPNAFKAGDRPTLGAFLHEAVGARLLTMPGETDLGLAPLSVPFDAKPPVLARAPQVVQDWVREQRSAISDLCNKRNALLHGNFAQAATQAGCPDVATYFATTYASELETAFVIAEHIIAQVDAATGRPWPRSP